MFPQAIYKDAKNFQRDTLLLASPYRKFFQYGINFRYMKSGNIMFYNGFQSYEDRLKDKQFNYNEKFFKVSINQQIGIFNLNMEGSLVERTIILPASRAVQISTWQILILRNLKQRLIYLEAMVPPLVTWKKTRNRFIMVQEFPTDFLNLIR